MKYRRLGTNGPQVSAISMGRGSQPIRFGDPLEQDFNAAIRRAYELGITFFDSSDAYWGTRHEVLLGRAIKGFRDKVLISSKFGNIDLPDGKKATNGRPEYVSQCCEASLRRMGVDVIDVYYLHRLDPATPIEETVGAMARLIEQGEDIVPIPGTSHARNVEQNAGAVDIVLTPAERAHLSEVFAVGAGAGNRYHDVVLQGVAL